MGGGVPIFIKWWKNCHTQDIVLIGESYELRFTGTEAATPAVIALAQRSVEEV